MDAPEFDPKKPSGILVRALRDLQAQGSDEDRAWAVVERMAADLGPEGRPWRIPATLFAYASERSARPLAVFAAEGRDDLARRYGRVQGSGRWGPPTPFEKALVDLRGVVAFRQGRLGLVHPEEAEGVALALQKREEMARGYSEVLSSLGPEGVCEGCGRGVSFIPLFKFRDIDTLQAEVCPECSHAQKAYFLLKGAEIPDALNEEYLKAGVVREIGLSFEGASVRTQVVSSFVSKGTARDLVDRLWKDLFERYGIEGGAGDLELEGEGGGKIEPSTPLSSVPLHGLRLVRAAGGMPGSEVLRRIREGVGAKYRGIEMITQETQGKRRKKGRKR